MIVFLLAAIPLAVMLLTEGGLMLVVLLFKLAGCLLALGAGAIGVLVASKLHG
jgi:hypothetical protein